MRVFQQLRLVHASRVIGCDGGSSTVRGLAGTPDPPNDAYFGTGYGNQKIGFYRDWLFLQCII